MININLNNNLKDKRTLSHHNLLTCEIKCYAYISYILFLTAKNPLETQFLAIKIVCVMLMVSYVVFYYNSYNYKTFFIVPVFICENIYIYIYIYFS